MVNSIADYALILHPADPCLSIATYDLNTVCRTLGLIGVSLTRSGAVIADWYGVGANFLDHITFLGCAPVIYITAHDGNSNYCRVHLPPPLPYPIWRASAATLAPRCPHCQVADAKWRSALAAWELQPLTSRHSCPACGNTLPLHQWRLREAAGFGCSFVELWGIHPWEAVPGEELLAALMQLSGGPWRWFYWSGHV